MSKRNSRDLINPFVEGETIIIPEGTKFYTNFPGQESPQRTTRQQIIEADAVFGAANDKFVHEPDITYRTPSGFRKEFVISRAMLLANNKPVEYCETSRYSAKG